MNKQFIDALQKILQEHDEVVMVTLARIRGSAPQEPGAKVIVGKAGLLHGTVGGGKLETRAIEHAKLLLHSNDQKNDFVEWNLQQDVGMTCGGVVSLFFEKLNQRPLWQIAIFGAGHVSQELVRGLLRLDCSLSVIDPRPEWLEHLPESHRLKKILAPNMASVIPELDPNTFIASMTMGHDFDLAVAEAALNRHCFPYVGAIGSKIKSKTLRSDLLKRGVAPEQVEKLICPIGEDIGNNTPAEIAISIMAQLLRERDKIQNKNM